MKRLALLTFATSVALAHFAAADGPRGAVTRHGGALTREDGPRASATESVRSSSPRQMSGRTPVHPTLQGAGGGINRSPRIHPGNVDQLPRTRPGATSTPVVRGNGGNNRLGNGDQDFRRQNGGNNQAGNDQNARRHRGGDGNHHWHGDWDRNHHHRDWWRNHYTRFVLFGGGYYYWNSGFWYPAYGYDPYYSTYVYDAPIYGYNSLPPGEVMATVQTELARLGYYNGAIDGTYGPLTREALLRYQQSVGLETTGLLDQATVESLGIY